MDSYYIKSINPETNDYLSIVSENDDGYTVRIVRDLDGYEEVIVDFMTKTLFDSCLRTGYLMRTEKRSAAIA